MSTKTVPNCSEGIIPVLSSEVNNKQLIRKRRPLSVISFLIVLVYSLSGLVLNKDYRKKSNKVNVESSH